VRGWKTLETKEIKLTDYKFVDVWYTKQDGTNSAWKRIPLEALPDFQSNEACNFNCFATIQRFCKKTKGEKGEDEPFLAPLYFDLDYAENPAVTLGEAVKIVSFFLNELDLQPSDIQIFFSGSKGVHVLVSSQALGIQPRDDLHKIFKHIASYLKYRLGDFVTAEDGTEHIEPVKSIDLVVYTSHRMLRLPNSLHQKTKLYKIELTFDELRALSIDQIKSMAAEPRRSINIDHSDVKRRTRASHFYMDKLEEYEEAAATSSSRYANDEYKFDKDNPPVCVKDIIAHGWKKSGDRNQATVQLAAYMKQAGYSQSEAALILKRWVTTHMTRWPEYKGRRSQVITNTISTVASVFTSDYKFGCAFIRTLHGEKIPGRDDYERVPCTGEYCPCIKQDHPTDEVAVGMHLANTGDANYTGKLVKTAVMIAGKKAAPYIVPKKIEYACWGYEKCKKTSCPLYHLKSKTAYKELATYDRELLQFCGIGDDNIRGLLKQLSGISQCAKYEINVLESVNVDEILVIPMAEDQKAPAIDVKETMEGKYVLRKIYNVGAAKLTENKYYEITGYVYPHPKNQEGTIIIRDVTPLQDVVDSFNYSDEVKEALKVFQPEEEIDRGSIHAKIRELCDDLTYNVTHIVERQDTLLAILLVYHSVLRIRVPWDTLPLRGWLECMVVGDTGTGKSAIVDKLMSYTGLGTRVNAESTSRTGLTYKMEQNGTGGSWYIVWGAWPLADREFIWIDEATGIKKEDYGEMTAARSEGKLEVKRAVTAETPCRVRAVISGNVPYGNRLADYGQGVESLKDIFNNEDIRRFDFALFMRASDVPPELYNQDLKTYPHIFSSEALTNNILFAWSRTADQVVFSEETLNAILKTSTELSKIYGNATDVPLVSPSDERNKVARLSVALAALTHSVDETGENIIVYPAHVEYVMTYLKMIFNAPGCGLNYYARLAVREEELSDERFNRLTGELQQLDYLKNEQGYKEFVTLFARQRYVRQSEIEAMLNLDKDTAKVIINKLTSLKMVEYTTGGYRKTPRFNAYVQKCFALGLFDNAEDDDF
jgi:hypothetical protein